MTDPQQVIQDKTPTTQTRRTCLTPGPFNWPDRQGRCYLPAEHTGPHTDHTIHWDNETAPKEKQSE